MPIRCLVICGDQYHPSADVLKGLTAAGGGEFEFVTAADGPLEGIDSDFEVVVLAMINVSSATDATPWATQRFAEELNQFVLGGKGLFVIHGGLAGYGDVPHFRQLSGGAFVHHPHSCPVRFGPSYGQSLAAGLTEFEVLDEHYFVEVDEGVQVFLTSQSTHGSQPAGWTLEVGSGRSCAGTPGHFTEVWSDPRFHAVLKNALSWLQT